MFKKLIASHQMRRRVSWIIAAILILPFIFFFHATGQAPPRGPGGTAGTLFGKPVPWEQFQEQQRWVRQQVAGRLGGDIPEAFEPMIARLAWDRILLAREAARRRVRVEDRELVQFIQEQLPIFKEEGRFVADRYHRFVRAMGMTPQAFERLLRHDLVIDKLTEAVKGSVTVGAAEVRDAFDRKHERLTATVIRFDPASFTAEAQAAASEEAVTAYYDAHAEEFRLPEQVTVDYAGASRDDLAPGVAVSEADVSAYYQDHQEQFTAEGGAVTPLEEVREAAREGVVEERVSKQLTALALDLQDDLDATLPFEEIVKTRALATRTAGPAPVEALRIPEGGASSVLPGLAGLPDAQLSEVLRTDHGVYVARVTQRIPSRLPPLEEVRDTMRERVSAQRARELARAKAVELQTRLKDRLAAGMRFEETLLSGEPAPAEPASFTRTEPIGSAGHAPQVNGAAFDTPLGGLTDVMETDRGFVIVHPEARHPADATRFAQQEAELRDEVLADRRTQHFTQWLEDLRRRARLRSFIESPAS